MTDLEYLQSKLKESGARLTKPRKAILQVVAASDHPQTIADVHQRAKAIVPDLGLVTVYRTIETLEEMGLIDRVHGQSDCQTIILSASGHNHLLTCTSCGISVHFEGILKENELRKIGRESGFSVNHHVLQLFGQCAQCRKENNEEIA
jgi:Fe2+ or Zn2+ uptake regulation protein